MMELLLLLLVALLVASISLLFFLKLSLARRPPGPKGLPIIGNLHQFDPINTALYFFQLSKKYGPAIYLKLGIVPTVVVSSPELAREVFRTQDNVFCSRPPFVSHKKLTYNGFDVVFTPYNDYWREMKKFCVTHLFSSKRVQTYSWIREEEVCTMIRKISSLSSESKPANLSRLVMTLTNSTICRIGFGKNYNNDEQSAIKFQRLLEDTQSMLGGFFFSDYLPFMGWVDKISGASSKLERVYRELDQFYQQIIDQHLDSLHNQTSSSDQNQQQDIVDIMLQLREKDSNLSFDLMLDHIKGVLMDIVVAGTDTSAATIVWAMTELMRNPKVMKKAQEEIRSFVKAQESSIAFIQEEHIKHLTYLKAVIKETFRVHPATPLLVPRQTIEKCTLGGKYQIEPKTLVYVNVWAIGRDPKIWENPETFLPDRFLGSPIDYKGQHFELVPFGAGRRICPGLLLGATTTELALANMLYFFDWELPAHEEIDMDILPGITVHKKKPLCLLAKSMVSSNML